MELLAILAAEAAHKNETPFLVIGGILAAFAVIVGVLGIVRPELPEAVTNAMMGIGALLVVGTMISVLAA